MPDGASISPACREILALLAASKNVLVSGPPGTGKSRLLAEVAHTFENYQVNAHDAAAVHDPLGIVAIPEEDDAESDEANMPSPQRTRRKVFRTVFHQNSKHRDFVTGIAPAVGPGMQAGTFVIVEGTLYRASEYAKLADGASLLVIDEINRGPAVQVFGSALVAIEADKRLAPDGTVRPETQFFEVIGAPDGRIVEYALPDHLYILAVQNQADTSVEPLDVAFLRRWEPYRLDPNPAALREYFHLPAEPGADLPEIPRTADDVLEASIRAWQAVNRRISLGRGQEFQIGHGVLMHGQPTDDSLEAALRIAARGWARILAHVDEVFFGDVRGVAVTLNATDDAPVYHPLRLEEQTFADDLRYELTGQELMRAGRLYDALRAIAA